MVDPKRCLGLLLAGLAGCAPQPGSAPAGEVVLATTTSAEDSGLLDLLGPRFEQATGLRLRVVAVGTGQALELGRRGDADVLLVHAPEQEQKFIREGHATERRLVFYNDFVLAGPPDDPVGVRAADGAVAALRTIAASGCRFVSRGDDSGTHLKEQALWRRAGTPPEGDGYLSAGAGMAETLRLASEVGAYTLTDQATLVTLRSTLRLEALLEDDPLLRNPYSVLPVNPARHPHVRAEGARRWVEFLQGPEARSLLVDFGRERYGAPLFQLPGTAASYPPPASDGRERR